MRHKLQAAFVVLLVMFIPLAIIHIKPGSVQIFADGFNTKLECSSNPFVILATAPVSVTTGSTINVTNMSSSSSVPAGITVNKIVLGMKVTNATPSTLSSTWTGTGVNSITTALPNLSFKATGAAGSKVVLSMDSLDIYINGGTTPISCTVAAGSLTASAPGESLTVVSVGLTAPVVTPPVTTGGGTTTTPTPTPTTSPTTTTSGNSSTPTSTSTPAATSTPATTSPGTTTAPTNSTATAAASSVANTDTTNQKVTILVTDSSGHALSNAKVSIDSLSTAYTDSKGDATFASITTGKHVLTVSANKNTVVRTITLDDKLASSNVAVRMPKKGLTTIQIAIVAFGSALVVILVIWGVLDWRKSRANDAFMRPQFAGTTGQTIQPVVMGAEASQIITMPTAAPIVATPVTQVLAPPVQQIPPMPEVIVPQQPAPNTPVQPAPAVPVPPATVPPVPQAVVVQPQIITPQPVVPVVPVVPPAPVQPTTAAVPPAPIPPQNQIN